MGRLSRMTRAQIVSPVSAVPDRDDDPVNHPAHYTSGGIECIDAIRAALGRDGFIAFLRGQVIKYQWRLGLKDDAEQDAAKARWYADRLVAELGGKA